MERTFFKRSDLTIHVWDGNGYYEVDLESCIDSAELLDFILQINGKKWDNDRATIEFLDCLEAACYEVFGDSVQGVYCPSGQDMIVDWSKAEKKLKCK